MYVHALHVVHALPDLRVVGGTFGGTVLPYDSREDFSMCDKYWAHFVRHYLTMLLVTRRR